MGIGRIIYKLNRDIRRTYFTFLAKQHITSCKGKLYINYRSWFNGKTFLGENVHFNGMRIGGCGKVIIGNNFHSGRECLMIAENHNFEGSKIPYDSTYICKDIVIEDNVWLGDRVIVLGGNTIGEGAIIQAGSVVVSNIPKFSIAGGHPAKVFNYRDKDHYKKMKSEGNFH